FTKERQLLCGVGCFGLLTTSAVSAFDCDHGGTRQSGRLHPVDCHCLLRLHFDFEHGLATLNSIAVDEKSLGHSLSIHKRAIGRTKVAQKATRWGDLQQAMIAGKESVVRQVKVCGV